MSFGMKLTGREVESGRLWRTLLIIMKGADMMLGGNFGIYRLVFVPMNHPGRGGDVLGDHQNVFILDIYLRIVLNFITKVRAFSSPLPCAFILPCPHVFFFFPKKNGRYSVTNCTLYTPD